jgi:hypothetical protein
MNSRRPRELLMLGLPTRIIISQLLPAFPCLMFQTAELDDVPCESADGRESSGKVEWIRAAAQQRESKGTTRPFHHQLGNKSSDDGIIQRGQEAADHRNLT